MEQNNEMSMKELLEQETAHELHVHDVVKGEVVEVNDKEAKVNLNTFTEGTIYLNHFTTDRSVQSLNELVKVGDVIEAEITKISENGESTVILLSRLNTLKNVDYEEFKANHPVESNVEAKVVKVLAGKGYILRSDKIEMFMSAKDLRDTIINVGDCFPVKIISYNDDRKNAFVSRYAVVREERRHAYEERQRKHEEYVAQKEAEHAQYLKDREDEYNSYNVGDVLKGTVAKIVPYGAFVKFDKVQGLIRLKDVDHAFIKSASEVINEGDEIEVKVISKEKGKLELSRKELLETPYAIYKKNHNVSDVVKARVANKMPFGVLCEMADHVTGLLHRTEYSWNPNDNYAASLKIGDEIEVAIIRFEDDGEKIGLSRKPLIDNPWARVDAHVGDKVTVKVSEVLENGFKVEALGVDGFVPFNQISTKDKNTKATDVYQVGDTFDALITEFNPKRWTLVASERALNSQLEREQYENYMQDGQEEMTTTLGDLFKDKI